jgi:hypothetical protein
VSRLTTGFVTANRDFRLYKASGWDSVSLERIEEATKEGRGADVGAIVLGEGEFKFTPHGIAAHRWCNRSRRHLSVVGAHDGDTAAHRYVGPTETSWCGVRARKGTPKHREPFLTLTYDPSAGHGEVLCSSLRRGAPSPAISNPTSDSHRFTRFHERECKPCLILSLLAHILIVGRTVLRLRLPTSDGDEQ